VQAISTYEADLEEIFLTYYKTPSTADPVEVMR
jgi:hypothetical protein